MKKFFAFVFVMCIVMFSGNVFGQDAAKNKNDKKGGFSAGGFDQSRKSKAPTRSIEINKEVEKSDKSIYMEKSAEDTLKVAAPAPAAAEPKEGVKEKDKQGNAYSNIKNNPGKDNGHSDAKDAKSKEKPKNKTKPGKEQK
jgi:hypothetical protein